VPFWNDDPRFSDPTLGPIMRQIVQERFAELFDRTKSLPEEPHWCVIVPTGSGYRRARSICLPVSTLLTIVSILCIGRLEWPAFFIALTTVIAGVSVWGALLLEITTGAGHEVHNSYQVGSDWVTKRSFEPSVNTLRHLLTILAAGLVAVIVGFGLCFWHLSVAHNGFSQPLNFVSAIYLSIVTFATVGFGDITPQSDVARAMIAVEILVSLFALGAVFSVTFSWFSAAHQRRYEAFVNDREARHIQYERVSRELKAGEYVDVDEIAAEAQKRHDAGRDGLTLA
jgi:hypothetical protein